MLKYQSNVFKRGRARREEWIPPSILNCPLPPVIPIWIAQKDGIREAWPKGGQGVMGRRKTKRRDSLSSSFPSPPRSPWPRFSLGGWETTSRDESAYCHTLLHATCISPIMHLASPPKFCMTFFFSFLLGIAAVLREFENNTYANFWGANKVHYGRCASGVLADHSLRC